MFGTEFGELIPESSTPHRGEARRKSFFLLLSCAEQQKSNADE